MTIIAVIPSYNEAHRVLPVVRKVASYVDRVIFVDDGSTDRTVELAERMGSRVTVLRHRINLGKGAALKTGCDAAVRLGCDVIVTMDADGQHLPEEIPAFIQTIVQDNSDFVIGARQRRSSMPVIATIGNGFLSAVTATLFNVRVSDTQSGFRALRSSAYPLVRWESASYSVETEMLVKAARQQLRIREIPIRTIYHDKFKGTTVVDGVRIFLDLLRWRFL